MRPLAFAALVFGFLFAGLASAADLPSPETNATSQDTLRSYLQLQEQLHATQLAIEQTRKDNAEAAARSSELLAAKLQSIETALSAQRARELEAMQSSNRVMLIVAGTFAFVGVSAMLLMAFFQWRTVQGLAELSTGIPATRLLGAGAPIRALGPGEPTLPAAGQVEQSSAKLVSVLDQIEKRIGQLEFATRPSLPGDSGSSNPGSNSNSNSIPASAPGSKINSASNGNGSGRLSPILSSDSAASQPVSGEPDAFQRLLKTGQALLDEDFPDRALAQFEHALALRPKHAEALVKKGAALERLQRPLEAITCYDGAIAADRSLTIAYLHKGGCLNRMEKFSEALQCYEQALRTQEKARFEDGVLE